MYPFDKQDADVVVCSNPRCRLRQFRTTHNNCRRCGHPLGSDHLILPRGLNSNRTGARAAQIGRRIRYLRIRAGFTQEQFARSIGIVDRAHISRIEAGRIMPTLPTLIRMALALHIDIVTFFTALFS